MNKSLHDRRGFLKKSTLATLTTLLGARIAFADNLPRQYVPLALVDDYNPMASKDPQMLVLGDKPWNVESPVHLLDDAVTPVEKMFIRNNGLIPAATPTPATWTLTINGESVKAPKTYTLADLKKRFSVQTRQLVLECGGNGRGGYEPQTLGNPWGSGAISCAEWTGVRLKDILADVGPERRRRVHRLPR